ncbi:hypothetical protein BY996DRAFT_7057601 [Phakopsora pachyrhizi]|nr:hypothetical protein BY996DRAFT_7057601 [Phakopsora pachyrhizi]
MGKEFNFCVLFYKFGYKGRIPLRRHIPASIKKDLIGLPNPSRRFEMYTGIQSHYQIEVVHLDEVQPALKELNNIYSSNGAAIPDIVRNICDYIANLDSESMIDLMDFSGYMHYIAKMIQFWRPLDTLMQEDILHHALLCNIAFHMGLLSLKQKFAQNLDWINLINFLLDTLNTKLQPIMKKEKTMDNFFEKHGKGLPWVQEYFFPNRRLNIDSDNDLRIKIKFDSKLEHHLIGIDFGRIHPRNRNKDFEDHTKAIAEIAKASSPASVQSKIAAMVSLYAASIDHAIPLLDEISKSEYSDPQIKELANYILNM